MPSPVGPYLLAAEVAMTVEAKTPHFQVRQGKPRMSGIFEVEHPLIKHHLARLRDKSTPPAEFRLLVQRLAVLLAYEATKDLELTPAHVQTPLTLTSGEVLNQRIGIVPILRAGLGMVDPVLDLIPGAEVWHLGVYRDESTATPVEYYSRFPAASPVDVALVLDPMLATGGSAVAALATLREWGVKQTKLLGVIAAREGIDEVIAQFPETQIYTCAIDPELNDKKYIVPGLGDAGDRIFNTQPSE
jgi:uracil phosphoribosyltransferase